MSRHMMTEVRGMIKRLGANFASERADLLMSKHVRFVVGHNVEILVALFANKLRLSLSDAWWLSEQELR